jgi:DNA-binding response OmpR family regulator
MSHEFDLLMADVILPSSSGTQVAVQIHHSCPGTAILFISGTPIQCIRHSDLGDFQRLLCARVDYLAKPFTLMTLVSTVENLVSGKSPLPEFRQQVKEVENGRAFANALLISDVESVQRPRSQKLDFLKVDHVFAQRDARNDLGSG